MSYSPTSVRQLSGGARLIDASHTHFSLWAPNATKVTLLLQDQGEYVLEAEESSAGWFSATVPCGAGTRYQYRVMNLLGDEQLVPDPVSRAQAESVHGYSVVVDPQSYQWRKNDWRGRPWHETILYELHVGAFGGFRGVKAKLASLAAMGFTAIELMPLATFPGDQNWGYDGVLPYAPHFSYGTPDDLKSLVDEAHALNMTIYLDVVYNHFGPDGNYLHHYAPAFFNAEEKTPWGSAIDFSHPEVRNFYTENALYWLDEYRFDGLRFDACHAIQDKTWLVEVAQIARKTLEAKRQVHLMAENDDNCITLLQTGFNAQWNDDVHHTLHVLLTEEIEGYYANYAIKPAEKLAQCLAQGFVYPSQQPELGAIFKAVSGQEPPPLNDPQLPTTAFVNYLQNHDQIGNRPFGERLTTLVPERALRVANALILLSPHIPMLFMGEEFGATQPFLYFTSHEDPKLVEAVREGRRTEFASFKKFADSGFALKIPDPNHIDTFDASIPRPMSVDSMAASAALDWSQWVSKLLGIRHHYLIPRIPNTHALMAKAIGPAAVIARWQMGDGAILAIAANLGTERLVLSRQDICDAPQAEVLFDYGDVWQTLEKNIMPGNAFIALLEGPL